MLLKEEVWTREQGVEKSHRPIYIPCQAPIERYDHTSGSQLQLSPRTLSKWGTDRSGSVVQFCLRHQPITLPVRSIWLILHLAVLQL
jgi:hypothetical protein